MPPFASEPTAEGYPPAKAMQSSSRPRTPTYHEHAAHARSVESFHEEGRSRRRSYESQGSMGYVLQQQDPPDLAPLQIYEDGGNGYGAEPVQDDDPTSYDLAAPPSRESAQHSLESSSEALFSREHLQVIFADPTLLLKFTAFLSASRPQSVPLLIYYLDALKAIRAINYANAICESLDPLEGHEFTAHQHRQTVNTELQEKAGKAFDVLAREDLPAYVTFTYIGIVSATIRQRVCGSLAPHLRDTSEGLAEVFCLTDPSRADNPIVFASEEFNRTTQYGMGYIIGKNCRFLQGPKTNPHSVRRFREAVATGRQHQETFLN